MADGRFGSPVALVDVIEIELYPESLTQLLKAIRLSAQSDLVLHSSMARKINHSLTLFICDSLALARACA